MIAKLDRQFTRLEAARQKLLESLATLDQEQLAFRPAPNLWNLLEVIQHLLLSEQKTYESITRRLQTGRVARQLGLGAKFRTFFMVIILRSPVKFKVPVAAVLPEHDMTFADLRADWDTSRRNWQMLLESLQPDMFGVAIFRHPVFGRLTISQTLTSIQEHCRHHLHQIRRIQRVNGFHALNG